MLRQTREYEEEGTMNKRISAILLAAVMLLGTAACGSSRSSGQIDWSDIFNSAEPKETVGPQEQDGEQKPPETAAGQQYDDEYLGQLEDAIYHISELDEDEIIQLYQMYDALPASQKRQIINREMIITAYQEIEALIAERKQAAAKIDALIAAIDYTNIYSEANSFYDVAMAIYKLGGEAEKVLAYMTNREEYLNAYRDVKGLDLAVTKDNFLTIFYVGFAVGARDNYGAGQITTQNGYDTEWDSILERGSITPHYDYDFYYDYATPVHVYVASRYPNLTSECSFYINLHQTYNGLGIIDSDVHEFERQSRTIQYDSSQGTGDYLIYVENKDATNSLLGLLGWSFDISDALHSMNPFDVSRVEITDISGKIRWPS